MSSHNHGPLTACSMKMYFSPESLTIRVHHLLFKKWGIHLDEPGKYTWSLLFVFLLCFFNQFLSFAIHLLHKKWSQDKNSKLKVLLSRLVQPCLLFLNVVNGFLIMLILMVYNLGFCLALLFGNAIGYTLFTLVIQELLLDGGKWPRFNHIQNADLGRL